MMTTSAFASPDRMGKARKGTAVLIQSELAGASGVHASVMVVPLLASVPDGCVSERLHGREMKVGLGQRGYFRRAAEAGHSLAALDPAHLVAEFPRDPDVMILALRHMQYIGLLVAERRLASLVVGKEFRVGFG